MANPDIADLNPAFRSKLDPFLAALAQAGIRAHVESGYRSPEAQAEIYTRSHGGRDFAAAPAWRSFHNYGLATDIIPDNPADYQRMWALAPQYGLTALGAYDKPHFQLGSNIDEQVKQLNLANWRPASMPAPAQGAIPYTGAPSQPSRPTSTPGTTLYSSPLDIVLQAESGDRNIPNVHATTSSGQAQGNLQITTGTWNDFAPKAGVDLKQYPTPGSAPRDVQIRVGSIIPLNRWAPSTVNAVLAKYPGIDTSQPLGAIQSAALGGSQAVAGGPQAPGATAAPGTTLPGFQAGSPGAKMAQAGLKQMGLGQGDAGGKEPPPIQPMQLPPPQAIGGSMMMGPGGMNVITRTQAANYPAMLASLMGARMPPVTPAGAATGIPGLPGTTLNSPSQLQMALMTGAMSPYDVYAGGGFQGQGST